MSFVAKVDTIKRTLGLPPDMAVLQAVGTACELMGIVPLTIISTSQPMGFPGGWSVGAAEQGGKHVNVFETVSSGGRGAPTCFS